MDSLLHSTLSKTITKIKPNRQDGVNNLRKGLHLVLKAPLENHEESAYSYYSCPHDNNPLWIVKIVRYYRKKKQADMQFYRSDPLEINNIINSDMILNLDENVYRVENVIDAHVATLHGKSITPEEILSKISDSDLPIVQTNT